MNIPPLPADADDLLPVDEALAAAALPVPVHPGTIRRHLANGVIAGVQVGARWRTTPAAIREAMMRVTGPRS